jgi:hypothetical protein
MAKNAKWHPRMAKVSGDRKSVRAGANNQSISHKSNECSVLQLSKLKAEKVEG